MFNFQMAQQLIQSIQNPQQMLMRMGIPQDVMSSPQNVAEYLLKNGRVTQQQIQQANAMYQQMNSNAQR